MAKGAIAYVDIWDRKPIGLFLIYTAIRWLGGEGFFQYQAVAALFACRDCEYYLAAGKALCQSMGRLLARNSLYLWQEAYSGGGGQSAIFYNLFTVAAAWLCVRAKDARRVDLTLKLGCGAMLLMVVRIQNKIPFLPEGMFFGLFLLHLLRDQKLQFRYCVFFAAIFCIIALIPTIIVCLYYFYIGHWSEFYYANFISVFDRLPLPHNVAKSMFTVIMLVAVPIIATSLIGLARMKRSTYARDRSDFWFFGLWLLAASVGFAMIGNFYYYYFMPVLVPLTIANAPNFRQFLWGGLVAFLLISWALLIGQWPKFEQRLPAAHSVDQLASMIRRG